MRLTDQHRRALRLIGARGISAEDPRLDVFVNDHGNEAPDTLNQLFDAKLAEQWCTGPSEDDHVLRLTTAGIELLPPELRAVGLARRAEPRRPGEEKGT